MKIPSDKMFESGPDTRNPDDAISRTALYDKAAELESFALKQVCKFDPRIPEQREEWIKWSAILQERAAFKHDIQDAPAIAAVTSDTKGKWLMHTYMPHSKYCSCCGEDSPYNKRWDYCPNCGKEMEVSDD